MAITARRISSGGVIVRIYDTTNYGNKTITLITNLGTLYTNTFTGTQGIEIKIPYSDIIGVTTIDVEMNDEGSIMDWQIMADVANGVWQICTCFVNI